MTDGQSFGLKNMIFFIVLYSSLVITYTMDMKTYIIVILKTYKISRSAYKLTRTLILIIIKKLHHPLKCLSFKLYTKTIFFTMKIKSYCLSLPNFIIIGDLYGC